jgi:YesN/AraC family two-component response regulator
MSIGMKDFLLKPVKAQELKQIMYKFFYEMTDEEIKIVRKKSSAKKDYNIGQIEEEK